VTALPPVFAFPRFRGFARKPTRAVSMPAPHSHSEYHRPVLVAEVVQALAPAPGKTIVDGTLGGGGHAAALLAAGARVIGLDQDRDAIAEATARLAGAGREFKAVRSNFSQVDEVLDDLGIGSIDGALLDLGVSSHQLDEPARGFSLQAEGSLDMRMDDRAPRTAADLVNNLGGEELERLFRTYGEEPAARRIAARLVRERIARPFTTTLQLAAAVESVVPRRGRAHPATRVFQALRIAVNREIEVLELALEKFTARLAPGGRLAIISFHSLEDRPVKQYFRQHSTAWLDRPEWPEPRRNPACVFQLITRKAVVAGAAELQANPRARSAKLRVVEKLAPYAP
jgi:16S rRNA (cytosine1402-N4)-methyltransferase